MALSIRALLLVVLWAVSSSQIHKAQPFQTIPCQTAGGQAGLEYLLELSPSYKYDCEFVEEFNDDIGERSMIFRAFGMYVNHSAYDFKTVWNHNVENSPGGKFRFLTLCVRNTDTSIVEAFFHPRVQAGAFVSFQPNLMEFAIPTDELAGDKNESNTDHQTREDKTQVGEGLYEYSHGDNMVDVYVIDSNVDSNHSLLRNYTEKPKNCVTNIRSMMQQDQGHGTAVAGVIACPPPPKKKATFTTFPSASYCGGYAHGFTRIIPIRVDGSTLSFVCAVNTILESHAKRGNPAVVNLSQQRLAKGSSNLIPRAFGALADANILVVAAAGNFGRPFSTSALTDLEDDILVVGATDTKGIPDSNYSNYGSYVDIYAPGTLASIGYLNGLRSNGFSYWTGTSFAAPYATSMAARLLSWYPLASPAVLIEVLKGEAHHYKARTESDPYHNALVITWQDINNVYPGSLECNTDEWGPWSSCEWTGEWFDGNFTKKRFNADNPGHCTLVGTDVKTEIVTCLNNTDPDSDDMEQLVKLCYNTKKSENLSPWSPCHHYSNDPHLPEAFRDSNVTFRATLPKATQADQSISIYDASGVDGQKLDPQALFKLCLSRNMIKDVQVRTCVPVKHEKFDCRWHGVVTWATHFLPSVSVILGFFTLYWLVAKRTAKRQQQIVLSGGTDPLLKEHDLRPLGVV